MIQNIQEYYALVPRQFGYLEQIKLSREIQESHCSDYTLELVMRPLSLKKNNRLFLTFVGVKDLKVGTLNGLVVLFLDIKPLHGYYLEGINFEVVENEYNTLSFSCANFTAKIINDN